MTPDAEQAQARSLAVLIEADAKAAAHRAAAIEQAAAEQAELDAAVTEARAALHLARTVVLAARRAHASADSEFDAAIAALRRALRAADEPANRRRLDDQRSR